MITLADEPLLLFVVSIVGLTASAWAGTAISGMRRILKEGARADFSVIQAATLTLLGLIIGFTFSMALGRYDQRKDYEEAEANAIGTEYLRAELLPAADTARVQPLLLAYLDQRVLFYAARNELQRQEISSRTATVQRELWDAVRTTAAARPDAVTALVAAGMNDVLNSQGYTQAAWWNRIPTPAWALMMIIAICSNILVGLGTKNARREFAFLVILPLVVSVAFLLIADIDSPSDGMIRVVPENLQSLVRSLRGR